MSIQPTGGRGFQPPSRPQLGAQPQTGPTSRPMMGNAGHPMAPGMQQMNPGGPGPINRVSPMHTPHMPAHMSQGHSNQAHMGHMGHMGAPNMHPSAQHFAGYGGQGMSAPLSAPSRSNTLVFILIAILIAAIAVLAYLVLTK